MAYNKQYNTRFSGRYNTPGQFVPAGELVSNAPRPAGNQMQPRPPPPFAKYYSPSFGQTPRKQQMPQMPQQQQQQQQQEQQQQLQQNLLKNVQLMEEDVKMESAECAAKSDDMTVRPHWMKSKLPGVKKVSNKERRRRQNENLRRLLTPKNALMVLNEMMPNEQVANQFKVEPSAVNQFYKSQNSHSFCADLTIDGNNYKGYGDNKLMARNAAAEQAIRDLIIKKMNKAVNSDSEMIDTSSNNGESVPDEEALPMIQLASFALHKLFAEWEYEGHKVPQLKPTSLSTSESPAEAAVKKAKELPLNARQMHPCMLLTYMRPHLEYRELAVAGDRPQNIMFTLGVDVDGATYIGKAPNKKEARKLAAKAACETLFNIEFEVPPPGTAPPPPAPATPAPQ